MIPFLHETHFSTKEIHHTDDQDAKAFSFFVSVYPNITWGTEQYLSNQLVTVIVKHGQPNLKAQTSPFPTKTKADLVDVDNVNLVDLQADPFLTSNLKQTFRSLTDKDIPEAKNAGLTSLDLVLHPGIFTSQAACFHKHFISAKHDF